MTTAAPQTDGEVGVETIAPVLRALVSRPWLWPAAAGVALRLARPGWWRRWPPLPLPDRALWRFRMETAYGGRGDRRPEEPDVVSFVEWTRSMRLWRRR
jgi:hypothetical protein